MFNIFKKKCPICEMDVNKGGLEKKGKIFCSKECYRKFRLGKTKRSCH
ncbi:MAG: hypothetical protein ACE5J4_01395 [Candidatus Aenigmatarchaeota archaeon]